MYFSSPRRRRAPNPIRIRRHANSPLLTGRSPAPWTPDHPVPPTPSTIAASDSTDTPTFPVSPSSATVSTCKTVWDTIRERTPNKPFPETADPGWGTDQDWGDNSPYPSTEDSPASASWRVAELERAEDSPNAVTPGDGISPGTVGIPRTPATTPVARRAGSAIAVGRRGGVSKLRRVLYSPGLPVSPPLRWWKGEGYKPVRETDAEDESESRSGSDGSLSPVLKRVRLQRKGTLDVKTCVCHGGGRAVSVQWWKYPLVVLLVVLVSLYVPWKEWI
ncbi:hypothetical protein CSIM01_04190 [Colletotrichum simmondsii]|uniref:Uncharacterized protein n=1 Tax=Colletotrichum simmondsii TaxID=703756 RepID=A0A135RNG2_9PEZI|nr:hypothetical protein CSIM01_04190 [Colletotrichum simmondsii]